VQCDRWENVGPSFVAENSIKVHVGWYSSSIAPSASCFAVLSQAARLHPRLF